MLQPEHKRAYNGNMLASKFPELKDFPSHFEMTRYGPGSFLGEDDIVNGRETYSCTVKCISETGILYQASTLIFSQLKETKRTWRKIEDSSVTKESKKKGFHFSS